MGSCCWSGDTVDGTGPVGRMRVRLRAGCGRAEDGGGGMQSVSGDEGMRRMKDRTALRLGSEGRLATAARVAHIRGLAARCAPGRSRTHADCCEASASPCNPDCQSAGPTADTQRSSAARAHDGHRQSARRAPLTRPACPSLKLLRAHARPKAQAHRHTGTSTRAPI